MKYYRILIEGQNCYITIDDIVTKVGFVTTRYLRSKSYEDVQKKASNLIEAELSKIILNTEYEKPYLKIEEIEELSSFEKVNPPGDGFAWYYEDENSNRKH